MTDDELIAECEARGIPVVRPRDPVADMIASCDRLAAVAVRLSEAIRAIEGSMARLRKTRQDVQAALYERRARTGART